MEDPGYLRHECLVLTFDHAVLSVRTGAASSECEHSTFVDSIRNFIQSTVNTSMYGFSPVRYCSRLTLFAMDGTATPGWVHLVELS